MLSLTSFKTGIITITIDSGSSSKVSFVSSLLSIMSMKLGSRVEVGVKVGGLLVFFVCFPTVKVLNGVVVGFLLNQPLPEDYGVDDNDNVGDECYINLYHCPRSQFCFHQLQAEDWAHFLHQSLATACCRSALPCDDYSEERNRRGGEEYEKRRRGIGVGGEE